VDGDKLCDALSADEFEREPTEAFLHTRPELTGVQVLEARKCVVALARQTWLGRELTSSGSDGSMRPRRVGFRRPQAKAIGSSVTVRSGPGCWCDSAPGEQLSGVARSSGHSPGLF
jgi:hypothetical protein